MSAMAKSTGVEPYVLAQGAAYLEEVKVVSCVFAAGTGNRSSSTDTAVRCAGPDRAQIVLKATKSTASTFRS